MNVLSLFDGLSGGQLALSQLGIKVDSYFASEIDEYAMKIAKKNFPKTMHVGDVTKLNYSQKYKTLVGEDGYTKTDIDLLIGGSPCQSFSRRGDGTGFDGSSKLFFEYVRLLKEIKPKFFMLENVVMKKEWQDIITEELGVYPIEINSRDFSAQNRPRLYWTNIPLSLYHEKNTDHVLETIMGDTNWVEPPVWVHGKFGDKTRLEKMKGLLDKASCVTATSYKGQISSFCKSSDDGKVHRYTPEQFEALQTLPRGYTEGVSNTQRYKMIGNGWTNEVIKHIFKNLTKIYK